MNYLAKYRFQKRYYRSQALVEFAMVLPIFLTLMCGLFDYGYMIGSQNAMTMAAREGWNAAYRQEVQPVERGLLAAVDAGRPRIKLFDNRGGIIITRALNDPSSSTQYLTLNDVTTDIGVTGGIYGGGDVLKDKSRLIVGGTNWLNPYRRSPIPITNYANNQQIVLVEIYYTNKFFTPIGALIGMVAPPVLYDRFP